MKLLMKLLIINPGGTSTKIAVFEDEKQILKLNITHTQEELSEYLINSIIEEN